MSLESRIRRLEARNQPTYQPPEQLYFVPDAKTLEDAFSAAKRAGIDLPESLLAFDADTLPKAPLRVPYSQLPLYIKTEYLPGGDG